MKYVITLATMLITVSLYATGVSVDFKTTESENVLSKSFSEVEINNTFIIGEGGHFAIITEALESTLVGDDDLLLLNSKEFNEGNLIIDKDVIIKASNELKNEVTIFGKVTINQSAVIMDNLTIENEYDLSYGEALEVNNGSLTVYEDLVILGTVNVNTSEINNFGRITMHQD